MITTTNKDLAQLILNRQSTRDRQILELRAQGLKTREIAERLNIKHSTCRGTLARLLQQHQLGSQQ